MKRGHMKVHGQYQICKNCEIMLLENLALYDMYSFHLNIHSHIRAVVEVS